MDETVDHYFFVCHLLTPHVMFYWNWKVGQEEIEFSNEQMPHLRSLKIVFFNNLLNFFMQYVLIIFFSLLQLFPDPAHLPTPPTACPFSLSKKHEKHKKTTTNQNKVNKEEKIKIEEIKKGKNT